MTWMTPFDACTSGVVTFALFDEDGAVVDLDRDARP